MPRLQEFLAVLSAKCHLKNTSFIVLVRDFFHITKKRDLLVSIYIYIHTHTHTYIYIHTHIFISPKVGRCLTYRPLGRLGLNCCFFHSKTWEWDGKPYLRSIWRWVVSWKDMSHMRSLYAWISMDSAEGKGTSLWLFLVNLLFGDSLFGTKGTLELLRKKAGGWFSRW